VAAGGRAVGRAAEGIIAKVMKDLVRTAGRDAVRTAGRDAARDGARAGARDAARDAARGGLRDFLRHPGQSLRDMARSVRNRFTRADPVDVATGEVVLHQVDVELAGLLPLALTRTHVSSYRDGRWFGPSWASTVDQRIEVSAGGVCYYAADGGRLCYLREPDMRAVLPVEGDRWPLTRSGTGWTVTDPVAGQTLHFAPLSDPYASILPLVAITDRNDHRIDLRYDKDDTLTEISHSGGYRVGVSTVGGLVTELRLIATDTPLVRFGYDPDGRLTDITNSTGRPQRLSYDADGRVTGWVDRAGTSYAYRYDERGRCVATEGTAGMLAATFAYTGTTTEVTDSLGHTTRYAFNDLGQAVAVTDPLGHTTTTEWDRYDRPLSRTDPLGCTTAWAYDGDGNTTAVTAADGGVLSVRYAGGRLPVEIVDATGARWLRGYDQAGNLVTETDPLGATTTYTWVGGRLAAITDALGGTTRIECDTAGLAVAVTDPLGHTTCYERDAFGRIVGETDPLGNTTGYRYTVEGRLAARRLPTGEVETWAYDGEDNLLRYTDAAGNSTRAEVGPFGLPAAWTDPTGAALRFEYDTEQRIRRVVNPAGLIWTYEYDAAGRLVGETDFDGRALRYGRDPAGQLVRQVNAAGEVTDYRRDARGNVVGIRAGDAVSSYRYDAAGRFAGARNAAAEIAVERDAAGRVVLEACNGRAVRSRYDLLGRRIGRLTPAGAESRWEYDPLNRVAALHAGGALVRFEHDPAGREVRRWIGTRAVIAQSWDASSRLSVQAVYGAGPGGPAALDLVQRRAVRYRADGLVTGVADLLGGERDYELDPAGRVTAVVGPQWTEQYRYRPGGDIAAASLPAGLAGGSAAAGPREQAGSRLRRAGRVRFEYDRDGRVVLRQHLLPSGQRPTWRYRWDAEDRLAAVLTPDGTQWRYRYDPLGRRIAKQRLDAAGTVAEQADFVWDGSSLAEQTDHAGRASTWDWHPVEFRPVGQRDRDGMAGAERFHAIVTDLAGAPAGFVTLTGQVSWRTPDTIWSGGPAVAADCPLRFPGQYRDAETGLYYNYHRYYDPDTGCYQSPDPLGLHGGPRPFGYVPNPTAWADPLGLTLCGDLTDMARTGRLPDKAGFTRAGHEYQKHMMRGELPPLPSQKPSVMNDAGHDLLDNILSDPRGDVLPITGKTNFPGGYHVVSNILSPNGEGFLSAVFDASHEFRYFGVYL
jgi:RHS repeat-associated protein